jgi:hypothetical protein
MCERSGNRLPRPLIPVLEELEADPLDLTDLNLEHVNLAGERPAEPRHAWQEKER